MIEQYDLVIIGAGPGGYTSALKASGLGLKVVVIEKERLGGTCLNQGCIPTKALLHAASLYNTLKNCSQFGLVTDRLGFQFEQMQAYKREAVEAYREEIRELFAKNRITFIRGKASLHKDNQVEVETQDGIRWFEGEHVILATGASPRITEIPGSDLPGVLTSDRILNEPGWNYDHLTILGGGVTGVEFATIFNALGSKVTIVEKSPRLLGSVDAAVSQWLEEELISRGIAVHCNTDVSQITYNKGLVCHICENGVWSQFLADSVLVTIGRAPYLEGLLAEDCLVQVEQGKIAVDSEFRTSQPGVFAIGDLVSRMQLAHVAAAQGTYVVEKIAGRVHGIQLSVVPNGMFVVLPVVPSCIYTDPEIAAVGITEKIASKYNMKVKCGRAYMSSNGKSIISREQSGFIQLIFEAYSNTLVGAQIVCPRATDMIGEMATAIANGLTSFQLSFAMRAHPTYSEAITAAIEDAMK